MNVALDQVRLLVLVDELGLEVADHVLPAKSVELLVVHRWLSSQATQCWASLCSSCLTSVGSGVAKTVSDSWMSALRNALVISTLGQVVSCAVAKLDISLSKGARFVAVVECSLPKLQSFHK